MSDESKRDVSEPFAEAPVSASYPLFKHMSDTYQLTPGEDELREIIAKADESRMKENGRGEIVRWALVNALHHLDTDQLHELGEAIAKRSGGTYTPTACSGAVLEREK